MDCSQPANHNGSAVKERMACVKHKIIVLSGKGGVGKSTVAVNLASALALEGKRVGLLDVDLHGPTVPQLLGLDQTPAVAEGDILIPVEVGSNLKVMSIGFLLGETDGAVVWRGPMKAVAIEQFLGEVEWGELDYLIIDSPPGTGDEPLAVCQALGNMAGAIIVTTPQETALGNVRRSIKFCQLLDLRVLGVMENMAGFVCPHCGETTDIFSAGGGEALAKKYGVPLLASVPLDPAIVEAGDSGKPYVFHFAKSAAAREFAKALPPILALDGANPDTIVRFAVPITDGVLCSHFGHCREFALIDVDSEDNRILGCQTLPAPEHEPGLLPSWLADRGTSFVIAGGMGSQAQQLFAQQGIKVITGAPQSDPEMTVSRYLEGLLAVGENVCDH